jgi:hypothetical protein
MSRTSALATAFAAGRAAFGVALYAAPKQVASGWLGEDAQRDPTQIAVRALGVRDVAIAAGTIAAIGSGKGMRGWILAAMAADTGDVVATLLADGDRLPKNARWGTVALAGGSVAAGAALLAAVEQS